LTKKRTVYQTDELFVKHPAMGEKRIIRERCYYARDHPMHFEKFISHGPFFPSLCKGNKDKNEKEKRLDKQLNLSAQKLQKKILRSEMGHQLLGSTIVFPFLLFVEVKRNGECVKQLKDQIMRM
jgi:hypothetical protein